MRTSLLSLLLVLTGCGSVVQPECQMMPSAQGGYVLRFTRTGAAAAGCATLNPDETSDVWIFDTLASSQLRAHSVAMPYPVPPVDPLPANFIGTGQFVTREADGTMVALELSDFDGDGELDLAVFEGASSGLLDSSDLADASEVIDPGSSAAILLFENSWATSFTQALRGGGAELVAAGYIPLDAVLASLDATER